MYHVIAFVTVTNIVLTLDTDQAYNHARSVKGAAPCISPDHSSLKPFQQED